MHTSVDWGRLAQQLPSLDHCASSLEEYAAQMQSVIKNMDKSLRSAAGVGSSLREIASRSKDCHTQVCQMRYAAQDIASAYEDTERRLAGKELLTDVASRAAATAGAVASQVLNYPPITDENMVPGPDIGAITSAVASLASEPLITDENMAPKPNFGPLWKVLGQFGVAGKSFGAIGKLTGDPISQGKGILDFIGAGAKIVPKIADGKLIDTFGLKATVDAIGFRENLAQQLDGYVYNSSANSLSMSATAKTFRNVGTIVKWGGIALSCIGNFSANLDEYNGDFSNPRLYAETVAETAIDTGLGILATAGVATLAGASAPVWAVGVVSTGAILGLDWVSKQLFDVKASEVISDGLLNAAEAVGKTVKKAGKAIGKSVGKAVKATRKYISAGWKKIKGWF